MRKLLFATAAAIAITTILTGTVRANEQEAMESVVANVKMLADNVCPKVESPIDEVTCRLEFSKLPLAVRMAQVKSVFAAVARKNGDKAQADRLAAEIEGDFAKVISNIEKLQKKYEKYTQ